MAVVRGTLTTSLENAERTTRRVAAHQGMTYFAPGSRPGMLVFRTGILGSGHQADGLLGGARTIDDRGDDHYRWDPRGHRLGPGPDDSQPPPSRAHCTDRVRSHQPRVGLAPANRRQFVDGSVPVPRAGGERWFRTTHGASSGGMGVAGRALTYAFATLARAYRCHSSGTPLSGCTPRSANERPEPTTRSLTVEETSTSPGSARAPIRAPIATAIPARSSPSNSTSPVCRPERTSIPSRITDARLPRHIALHAPARRKPRETRHPSS